MNKLITTGTFGLAALVTTGLVAWQAPSASADHGSDGKAFKRDDDSQVVLTTVDDDDDDDTGLDATDTGTGTSTGAGVDDTATTTNTLTRGDDGDDSRYRQVQDLTDDGRGSGNVDHSRHDTNDASRHNTRG